MNDSEEGEGAGDPAAAFDALRLSVETQGASLARQIADLRRGVEAASEGIDKIGRGPDASGDLARIMKSLDQVSCQLHAIQNAQSPIEVAADRYVKKFEESGTAMLSAAITVFGESSHELRGVSEKLGERLALAKGRYVRLKFLGLAGGGGAAIGALAGIVTTLFLPAMFPSPVAPRVAALVMRQEPWEAGMDLMKFASAEGWSRVASADELFEANSATVSACREAAAKTKRDQKCPITVAAPVP
ncbi:MAG: DUF6118 family protein [Xanthobacteraceae bacterium]